jgi:hypothetical protein
MNLIDRVKELEEQCKEYRRTIDELRRPTGYAHQQRVERKAQNAYLALHPEECDHPSISYGPYENEEWYERCSDCGKRITQDDRDKFID